LAAAGQPNPSRPIDPLGVSPETDHRLAVCYHAGVSERLPVQPRPRPAVPARERRFVGRRVADVHGRRTDVVLANPNPGVENLVDWLTPSFYVDFGRPCNSACLYCAVPPHEDAQGFLPMADVSAVIEAGRAVACDRAILIGGEPTIYPSLFEVLDALDNAGFERRHIVMTNGVKLADKAFADRLLDAGVRTVHFSLDTASAATYDALSRSEGRFDRQRQGLANALARTDRNVYVYTAVTRLNAGGLPDLAAMIARQCEAAGRPAVPWVLAVIKPIGDGLRHADTLQLSPTEAVEAVRWALEAAEQHGIAAGFRNVQACLAPDLVDRNVDYYLDDFSVEVATGQRVTYSHTEYWRKPASCDACGHNALCTGIYHEMQNRYGDAPYRPIGRDGLR